MLYRMRQFWQALHPVIQQKELEWAYNILPVYSLSLFTSQPLPEQRHALDVALDLWQGGVRDSQLLIAALLHDCGKTKAPLKIWERVFIVLLQKAPAKVWYLLTESDKPFLAFLHTAVKHPEWGAEMASSVGLEPEIVELIREHHSPKSEKGKLLYEADNRH
jgi:putative nucleotidyltransferase with HDIG domain